MVELNHIRANEAHLWYGRPDSLSDATLLRRYKDLLTRDEREKIEKYHFAADQHAALITRATIRCLLSRYFSVEPCDWEFRTNPYGRPEIAKPSHARELRFNISHTKGMLAIAICRNRSVGVDVERLPCVGPFQEIADNFFSHSEASTLRSLPSSEQQMRFVKYWTLKESFLKALGLGLAISLDQFSFRIDETSKEGIEIDFAHRLDLNPDGWQFSLNDIDEAYIVATAIERMRGDKIQLLRRKISFPTLT